MARRLFKSLLSLTSQIILLKNTLLNTKLLNINLLNHRDVSHLLRIIPRPVRLIKNYTRTRSRPLRPWFILVYRPLGRHKGVRPGSR